ncbi:hypothetical protein [Niallia sp. FSL R7-0271]|uniref:hypothetical protein n=1 Tax=Niallia sp. FSL R7-0271 TaxID=2921678 RepID=UPI0030FAE10C
MNVILGALNGMLQYSRGREVGGYGILGIVIAIVAVYQWDNLLPVLRRIGVVDFFDKIGLIYINDPGTTGLAVFLFILEICIVLAIVMVAVIILGLIVSIFCSSKVGTIIILTLLSPIIAIAIITFVIFYLLFQTLGLKSKKQRMRDDEDKWYMENYGTKSPQTIAEEEHNMTPINVLKRYCEEWDYDTAMDYLNTIPMYGDKRFLLGETTTGEIYVLLPDPTIKYSIMNPGLSGELTLIGLDVQKQKYIDDFVELKKTDHRLGDRKLVISFVHQVEDSEKHSPFAVSELIIYKPAEEIIRFFMPDYERKDFKAYLSPLGERKEYTERADRYQQYYFETKERLLKDISNAKEKYEFEQLVSYVKTLNAPNEDVIKLMRDSSVEMETN